MLVFRDPQQSLRLELGSFLEPWTLEGCKGLASWIAVKITEEPGVVAHASGGSL